MAGEERTTPSAPGSAGFEGQGMPWMQPAPRASCSSGDMPEGELQGEGVDAVRCNLVIAGQVAVPHFSSVAWYGDCAYVNATTGTSVIDVSDSTSPTVVTTLTTSGMLNAWESMKVHQGRGLLVGYGADSSVLDIYDVSQDCKEPVLMSSFNVGGLGHSGNYSPDGTIYYASSLLTDEAFAVDITDPAKPTIITDKFFDTTGRRIGSHDLSISKDGSRAYFAYPVFLDALAGTVAIMDVSAIQARAPNAEARSIKDFRWSDGAATQYPIAISYGGEPYLLISDELGSGACDDPSRPQFSYGHIFDIRDELNPTLVAQIKTEAQDHSNCERATMSVQETFFGVGTHYCNVDRIDDPRLLSCGLWSGGARVFDIRNPWRPKEVAYFDTAGTDDTVPGMQRIRTDTKELWVATTAGTFYVMKFAEGVLDEIIGTPVPYQPR